ncbi:MAG: polymerase I protein, partial [Parcubacteria group bacterium GW2011_GWE2_38_18]
MSRGITEAVVYDEEKVIERFALAPDQIVDYKALRGDPSDNIPGVRGIGEKTATELLQKFETLENLYKQIDSAEIREKVKELLLKHKEDAFMSKRLATINLSADIDFDLAESTFGEYDQATIVKLLGELEFKSLLPRVQELGLKYQTAQSKNQSGEVIDKFERNRSLFKYISIDDDKSFESFLKQLSAQKSFVIDTETSSLDPITTELLGISFSWKEGEAFYLKFKKEKAKIQSQPGLFDAKQETGDSSLRKEWLEKIKPILENENVEKYGHNMKFDIAVLFEQGIEMRGSFDTMLASYLLNPGTRQHNLDALTFTELGFEKISKDELLGKGKDRITFDQIENEKLAIYSCEDADFTFRLVQKLAPMIKKEKLEKLYQEIELPLITVLAKIERNGVKIDSKFLNSLGKKLHKKIKNLEDNIYNESGEKFNINSTQQLREVLYEKLEIASTGIGKTKTGFSTAADELEKLKDLHPIIKYIQEYRELNKLVTTYVDTLPLLVNAKTNRLHSCFNQTITATGRLSSSEPNLQNIPIRGEWGKEVRKSFVVEPGYKMVGFDYSQIELRLAAHMSEDKKMIQAFKEGVDIHTATAAAINEISLDQVTKKMRSEAKATNFGILYGQGPHGLSQAADISYVRAKEFIDNYFSVYTGIKEFMTETIEEAKEKGFIETLFGRRRYLPEINSSVIQVKKGAERMAINTPLQGTAADMIKVAMIEVQKYLDDNFKREDARMILQVHDELVFEVKEELVDQISSAIKNIMESPIKLKVPVVVDVKVGNSWGEME